MHQRRRLLAAVACYQAARATIPLAVWVAHRLVVLHGCMKRLAQGVTRTWIRTNECLGRALEVAPAAHASTEALACGGGVLSSCTCNQFHPPFLPSGSLAVLHGCMKRLAQGVTRTWIRTNECLGRALEVAPAAHASTEALACGGGVLSSCTCNQFHPPFLPSGSLAVLHGCMKRLAQGVTRTWIRTNECLGRALEVAPAAHASTEALACGGGVLSSCTCNQFHPPFLPSGSLAVLHGCMKRLAQGVTRTWIRTNECLGRALEVAPAAHASTEALACGGGVLSSRTCRQFPWRCGWLIDWRCCMHA